MSEQAPVARLGLPEDDGELRRLSGIPMPGGWVDLRYCREPSFYAGLSQPDDQVLVTRYLQGQAVAMSVRSVRSLYLNGFPQRVGYLSGLRVDPRYQGRYLLWEGYRLLRRIDLQEPISDYLATIIEGNQHAERLLVARRRASWPQFQRYGQLLTLALAVGRRYSLDGLQLDPPASQVNSFLRQHGPGRQFFPVLDAAAPTWESRRWLAHDGGVVALRDLSRFRQTVVDRYRRPLNWLRPLYNLWARLARRPILPAPGQPLQGCYAGYLCTGGNWPQAFRRLLEGLLEIARRQGKGLLYLGLMDTDPYLPLALSYPHTLYRSTFYRVSWEPQKQQPLDDRPAYLELASL